MAEGRTEEAELEERLSEAEERFERLRRRLGLFLGPLLAALVYALPLRGLGGPAHALAAIIAWVVAWWITEPVPIPVTSLLGASLAVAAGVSDAKAAFAPFGDPVIYLFLGSFIIAKAMSVHGLDKRFAYRILSLRAVGNSAARVLFVFGALTAALSMWISNTATTAMMFPIALGIVSAMSGILSAGRGERPAGDNGRFATGVMLMTAFAASIGGIGTPVGTPPNLIGLAMLEKYVGFKIPFFRWMMFAVPLLIVMYAFLFAVLYLLHRPQVRRIRGTRDWVRAELGKLGPMTRGQKNALIAFLVAVTLWVLPGFFALFTGVESALSKAYNRRVPEAVAALTAAALLFLLPVDWKKRSFTLNWRQAVQIDWGTLLLFGGGISLGEMMFKTGLAEAVGRGVLGLFGATSLWGLTLAAVYLAIFVSEATSNTASATMIVPVIISVSQAAGVNPVPPAVGAIIGASYGFMLPVSTPPNAIVYGSGRVPITRMLRAGVLVDLGGGILVWAGLRVLLPLVGLG